MSVEKRAQKRKRESEPKIQDARMPVVTIADLPLELIEKIICHLDVKDVLKLMMANKSLYSSYAMDQSIVFGKHVAVVALVFALKQNRRKKVKRIWKFADSPYLELNATLLPLAKRIDSCDKLKFSCVKGHTGRMLLGQLKSVNKLVLDVGEKEDWQKFLTNFFGSVEKDTTLEMSFKHDQAIEEQLSKFFENKLNGCDKITLDCYCNDWFNVYHEAMMETKIKMISVRASPTNFDKIAERIVNQGIPSKNFEAAIFISSAVWDSLGPEDLDDILSQAQGVQRVDDGENHSAFVSRANEVFKEDDHDEDFSWFDKNSSCFRRQVDATTSCIYVWRFGIFGAFYMPFQF